MDEFQAVAPAAGGGMKNPFTFRIESWLGSIFIVALAGFFIGLLFIAMKNFDSDSVVLNASQTSLVTMSSTERQLIAQWISDNNITLPPGQGFNYLVHQYPDRPWLKQE